MSTTISYEIFEGRRKAAARTYWGKPFGINVSVLKPNLDPSDELSSVSVDNLFVDFEWLAIVSRPATGNARDSLIECLICEGSSRVGIVVERADVCVGVGCAIPKGHVLELQGHRIGELFAQG